MKRRFPAYVLCLLLICSIFIPISLGGNVKNIPNQPVSNSRGTTLYVGGSGGDNYTKIQDAINDAVNGDTVYVYDDSSPYNELLVIDKSINLIGEDKNTTVIDGNYLKKDIVVISAESVVISGFTIQHTGEEQYEFFYAIIINSNNCIISDNLIIQNDNGILIKSSDNIIQRNTLNNYNIYYSIRIYRGNNTNIIENNILHGGIYLRESNNNIIKNNTILDFGITIYKSNDSVVIGNNLTCKDAIAVLIQEGSNRNIVSNNYISNNRWGIKFGSISDQEQSNYNIVNNNIIINCQCGIEIEMCANNLITNNFISNNDNGISFAQLGGSRYNTIISNIISNNGYGIKSEYQLIFASCFNDITKNNLIDNEINAHSTKGLLNLLLGLKNNWNNNYYSDYTGGLIYKIPVEIIIWISMEPDIRIPIPFFTFDWHPASEPYDIEV